jgi:hypothetical protein
MKLALQEYKGYGVDYIERLTGEDDLPLLRYHGHGPQSFLHICPWMGGSTDV